MLGLGRKKFRLSEIRDAPNTTFGHALVLNYTPPLLLYFYDASLRAGVEAPASMPAEYPYEGSSRPAVGTSLPLHLGGPRRGTGRDQEPTVP